jgi:hypothetical protein
MTAFVFDTLKVAKTLQDKGRFGAEQSEAVAGAIYDAFAMGLATKDDLSLLAAKTDLAELKASAKTDLSELKASTKADLAEAKAEIIKGMFGTIGCQRMIIIGAAFALAHIYRWQGHVASCGGFAPFFDLAGSFGRPRRPARLADHVP